MFRKCLMILISSVFLFTGMIGLDRMNVSAADYEAEQPGTGSESLRVKIKTKTSETEVGSTVKFNAESDGGVGTVKYKYRYKINGGEWVTFRNYSMVDLAKFRPDTPGFYKIIVYARDTAAGKITSSSCNLTVKQHSDRPLSVSSALQTANPDADQDFKVYAFAGGGTLCYRYSYSYIDGNGKSTVVKKLTYDSKAVFRIPLPGKYTVVIGVTDADNNYQERRSVINVSEKPAKPLYANAEISSEKISVGETLSISMNAEGGSKPYSYSFSYMTSSGSIVNIKSGSENNVSTQFENSGFYTVKAVVYDKNNNRSEKQYNVTVTKDTQRPLSLSGFLSDAQAPAGKAINVTASALGGVKPYLYNYRCIDENGKTVSDRNYSTSNKSEITVSASGFYNVVFSVKDSSGKVSEKTCSLCVTKDTGEYLKTEIDSDPVVEEGKTVRFNVLASGGTEPYEYRYSYKTSNGQWTVFKDYSTSKFADLQTSEKGYITVKAEIRDGSGTVNTEETSICSYSKNATAIIAQTTLQELPNWASKSLMNVPKGSNVNIITQYGHWFYVYCQGTEGWIYNRAIGNYTNYTTVSTATLPDIADDIIFERGKDPFKLFRYVTGMAYRAMEKDSIENMCVELIKYKRGACYQRAAMVYYLYLRAGFDVVRVTDGIDDYTGGGPHNWVILKTENGYRHVDPTQVIGLPEFYMVTDDAISPYFSWDRKKYPACK